MKTHIRPIARFVARALTAASLSAVMVLITNACSDSARVIAPAGEVGRVQLNLVGTSNTNRVYRLRDARFTITSRATGAVVTADTASDPGASSLQVALALAEYEVYLQPGYTLEFVESGRPVAGAELVSTNPALVTIAVDATRTLNFVFRVGDVTIETGQGTLELELEVQESDGGAGGNGGEGACPLDASEPNDSPDEAQPISAGSQLSANLCGSSADYYEFGAPLVEGVGFSVHVRSDLAGVEALVVALPSEGAVGAYTVTEQVTRIDVFTKSDSFGLRVLGNPAASYTVDIGECEACSNDAAVSDGCTTSDVPGSADDTIHRCICATDPSCCTDGFDELCVVQAIAECGAECPLPPPSSDCCSASSLPGCSVPDVAACVCEIDPFCCATGFDDSCARLAQDPCGGVCL